MPKENSNARKRLLDPIERSSEVLFGLIMVLTFTGSFRASGADHDSVDRMLVARSAATWLGASLTPSCT